ncbi:hypothetical protein OHA98_41050 [Streptomyces sp. NBC_00654]|uniref:hypothetical protein n=1 Tax=Streptomyces sp. NBC_00654 TaxID=2975799 RepID=UPI00224DF9B9|nr:hypothetical protein [Streptomyces sp. NBC_00654]MCX4971004.1 hypothetical protein [Streptomyces sp. NBC_00654]
MPSHNIPRQNHLPAPVPKARPGKPRFAALRTWWTTTWKRGGLLHTMWEDILSAPQHGFRHMASWLRTVLTIAGASLVVVLAKTAGEVILRTLHQVLTADTSHGMFAVVDQPVRTYIAQHSAGLPVEGSTVYTLWLLTGIVALVLGYLSESNSLRATWAGHGAATVFMVWTATPENGRPVAAGLTLLAWTVLSAFALHGLTLRRPATRPATVAVRPEIHVPAPAVTADQHTGCPFRG